MVSEADILEQLKSLLSTVDFQTTTERMIRQQLEAHFKEDLSSKKQLIRTEINNYLAQQKDPEEDEGEEEEEEEEVVSGGGGGGSILSEALQEFLGVSSMRRPAVVKELWDYIKKNDLQDPKNKKNIRLDDKLATLFTAPLNMLNMNKQLNKHVKGSGGTAGAKRTAPAKPRKSKKVKGDDDESAPKKSNSAFSKPLKISQDLADFLGTPEASRGEITKKFWAYFKDNNLQDPSDKRWILADDTLRKLLGEDRFQGFALSKLVQRHIL